MLMRCSLRCLLVPTFQICRCQVHILLWLSNIFFLYVRLRLYILFEIYKLYIWSLLFHTYSNSTYNIKRLW
jgi:hypothetical protein